MVWPFYYAFMYLMTLGIRISALWNGKSALWIAGRKNWKQRLTQLPEKTNTRIWFHVSSLGEFEQARPVMEELKKSRPELEIILTFFSPSGYEIRKNHALATVLYLPADLPGAAKFWIDRVRPDLAVFVKYDLWPGFLNALKKANLPYLLISAHFRPGTLSSWSVPPANSLLKVAKTIFLQDNQFIEQLTGKGFRNLQIAGDTRIDRTFLIAQEASDQIPEILKQSGSFALIAGSTWEADEKILLPVLISKNLRAVIAPHDVREENIDRLERSIPVSSIRFSKMKIPDPRVNIIIIDSIGLLAYLYVLGKVAYIGGGFGKSIHNILEPAAHHKPILFGPHHKTFPEAIKLITTGAAKAVSNGSDLSKALDEFLGEKGIEAGRMAGDFIEKNKGATDIVTSYILDSIPFVP